MELSTEDELILLCIKIHSTPEELEQMDGLIQQVRDWEKLIQNVIDRGIGPLFFKKLPLLANSGQIPESLKNKLQQAYYKTFSRSTYLYDYFRKVAGAFREQGLDIIVLKGIYLSEWLYGNIGLRQFSDMDLLVREEDAAACIAILAGMGYKPCDSSVTEFIGKNSEIVHYAPMVWKDVSVEIHIKLHRRSSHYELNIGEFISRAIPVTINTLPVKALNLYDLLIHLCVHLDKHFRGGHVQFTCFNDITNLLDIYGYTLDWEEFIVACLLHKCEHAVMAYIVLVNKYMHVRIPERVIQKYSPALTEADEQLFIRYLNGYIKPFNAVPTHLSNLKGMNLWHRSRYVWDLLFPPKAFMIPKYGNLFIIHNSKFIIHNSKHKILNSKFIIKEISVPWWFLYPYRWGIGVKGVMKMVGNPRPLKGRKNP